MAFTSFKVNKVSLARRHFPCMPAKDEYIVTAWERVGLKQHLEVRRNSAERLAPRYT